MHHVELIQVADNPPDGVQTPVEYSDDDFRSIYSGVGGSGPWETVKIKWHDEPEDTPRNYVVVITPYCT
jgi:hypothetical protein